MASKGGVYSQTLHDITNTKLDELAKKRATFETQRERVTALTEAEQDATKRLAILAKDMKNCFAVQTSKGRVVCGGLNNTRLEIDLKNLDRFLAQARYDPSVSSKILQQWQRNLFRHFEVQSLKFTYASLYGQLTNEWLSTNRGPASAVGGEDAEMEDFEHVSAGKKVEFRLKWEQSVFTAAEVDEVAVTKLLQDLFESTPNGSKHLLKAIWALQKNVEEFERRFASEEQFNSVTLQWTIESLVASDLLDDEKRAALRDFMGNPIILNEIADVLNMRMAAMEDWSWGKEVLLEERRQLNGTYNIYMQEDLLQAIFLQYIGVRWSVFWKTTFISFRKAPGVWKVPQTSINPIDRKRRDYYLGATYGAQNVDSEKQKMYRRSYFLSQLLNSESQETSGEEGDEEANFEQAMHVQQAAPSGRTKQTSLRRTGGKAHRKPMAKSAMNYQSAAPFYEAAVDDEDDDDDGKPKNAMEAKQTLLHLLSTDILIKTRVRGELTCFRSQIDNLNPSLPHATIQSIFRFLGVSQKWLTFFNNFLKAPLRFKDDESSEPRLRQTGTPGSHVLSEVFGEVVLFCLDFQINRGTCGEPLWRMHDDFWFWSSNHATCVKAWSLVNRFVKTTGLGLNKARTGAVRISHKPENLDEMVSLEVGDALPQGQIRWGMLYLNPESGRFEIDQKMVDKHIEDLSRQLRDKRNNIFAWIQAWNSYAATFFTSNFGKPANCFGRQHVDNMLATHERIQRQIFSSSTNISDSGPGSSGGSVIEFLKGAIENRFGVRDVPDGYFYFPTELGGLEVRNPFIGLLQIRDAVRDSPGKLLADFEEAEKDAYRSAKARFEDWRSGKIQYLHNGVADLDFRPTDCDTFFSFEEFTKYRESLHYGFNNELVDVFATLLQKPEEESIESEDSGDVKVALNALSRRTGLKGITSSWYGMEPYWKWVAQLYGPEMIEMFGGLSIVDPSLLPMGMVSLFRSGRVEWQE